MRTDDPSPTRSPLKLATLTEQVIGDFFTVFNELGPGFLESVYKRSMAVALAGRGLRVELEAPVEVRFRGTVVGAFRTDLLVERSLIVELKAVRILEDAHLRQAINYLRASNVEVALLLNFGPKPQIRRVVLDAARKRIRVHP